MDIIDDIDAHIIEGESRYSSPFEILVLCPKEKFPNMYREIEDRSMRFYKKELFTEAVNVVPPKTTLPLPTSPDKPAALWGTYRGFKLSIVIAEVSTIQIHLTLHI